MPWTLSTGFNGAGGLATTQSKPTRPNPTTFLMASVVLTPGIPPFTRGATYHLYGGAGTPDVSVNFEWMTGTTNNPPISILVKEV